MNNKIAWVVGALVVLAIAGYFVIGSGSGSKDSSSLQNGAGEETSLKQLLASQEPQKCTFKDDSAETKTEGTVYIANGKMRGDFSTTAEGQVMAGHMIISANTMHTWVDGMPSGFKMSLEGQATSSQGSSQGLDADKKMDYRCEPWSAESSKFNLPSGINFTDMSAMMQGSAGASGSVPGGTSCSACDNVPDSYKAQCRQALGCS